jgi:hypothetical protein
VVKDAIKNCGFTLLEGKYYLGDAGFTYLDGLCLLLYDRVRYYLREWVDGNGNRKVPKNYKELFNLRYLSLRMVVEKTFSVIKSRFRILKSEREGMAMES